MFDPFVIYNDHGYASLRESVCESVHMKQIDTLVEATNVCRIIIIIDECPSSS